MLPSPDKYNIKGQFGTDNNRPKNFFTFGVSRTSMQPIHIDRINTLEKQRKLPPGPGEYDKPETFGKEGTHRSFSSLRTYEKVALKKSRLLPGPGHYDLPSMLSRNIPSSMAPNAVS